MDLMRFKGMDVPNDKGLITLMDRVTFHSGNYFFTVIHAISSKVIFEVWSTEYPWDPERFEEDITNSDLMVFKLSVYCQAPITDMNFTMKESSTGDPYMLLDCDLETDDIFHPVKGIHYTEMDPILETFKVGEGSTDGCNEYVIAIDQMVPEITDITIPITDHRFFTTIRLGKLGANLEDEVLDYVYEEYVRKNAQDFQTMIGYDQTHYVQFGECTRAKLDIDQITINILTQIIGLDELCFTEASLDRLTCLLDRPIFPISSNNFDQNPNLLLVGPYFYRRNNILPFINSIKDAEADDEWGRLQFDSKVIQFFDTEEALKKSKKKIPNLLQYAKSGSMEVDPGEGPSPYLVNLYVRTPSRAEKYRIEKKKNVDPIGYVQISTKDPDALSKQGSATILKKVCPYILKDLNIFESKQFRIIYREPTKLHIVF